MKKQVSTVAAVVIVLAVMGVVAGLWYAQPFKPKIYGLDPPTTAERHQQAEEMKQAMIESHQAKKQSHQAADN